LTPLRHQAGSGQPGPRWSHGLRCRRPSSDLFPTRRLSTKVFLPPASPYSSPTLRLSSPTLPLVFQASPTPYPIVFPAPPTTPYPLSFTTSCFHEFEASQPMSFTHPRRLQKRIQSRAEHKETNQKTLGKKSLKLVHKTSAGISRRRHLTTLPSVFQQGGDEEKMK